VLVSIGIVVLLGGVWIVSIQSGGGGIDLGTWDEEIVDLNAEDLGEYNETDEEISTIETMPLLEHPISVHQERSGLASMVRESRSESSMSNISGIDKHGFGRMETQISLTPDGGPRRRDSLYDSPRIPSIHTGQSIIPSDRQHARISTSPAESPILNRIITHTRVPMHQATSSFHLPHPHAHALAHGTLSSPLGPALQIGLSPVSPGFAILPLERKKSNAYTAGGDGVVGGNAGPRRRRYWRMQRRRTISDGEVSRIGHDLRRQAESMDDQRGEVEASREGLVGGSEVETSSNLRQEEASSNEQQTEHSRGWLTNFLPKWSHKD
jgi:hypothetical protein